MAGSNSSRRDAASAGSGTAVPDVIVVGAGVSGCACAATLATKGLSVTLINSAMDRVGLPAYGPDLIADNGDRTSLEACLKALPAPLATVWLESAAVPSDGEAVVNVDRRRIGIETKRILEQMPGLRFRQGLVTDIRLLDDGSPGASGSLDTGEAAGGLSSPRVQVETIFGEVFEASALVIAVGMSMGGSIAVGADLMPGGRYGEPASEGVREALESLGTAFREVRLEVGARTSARRAAVRGWMSAHDGHDATAKDAGGADLAEVALVPVPVERSSAGWPEEYPPAPHWLTELRLDRMVMGREAAGCETGSPTRSAGAAFRPVLSPDGSATGEVYIAPGGAFAGEVATMSAEAAIASRMPLVVRALALAGLGDSGRVRVGERFVPVWVIGRAGGASDYAASLGSGVRAGADIAWVLGEHEAGA